MMKRDYAKQKNSMVKCKVLAYGHISIDRETEKTRTPITMLRNFCSYIHFKIETKPICVIMSLFSKCLIPALLKTRQRRELPGIFPGQEQKQEYMFVSF